MSIADRADELGLELNEDAFDSLANLDYDEACALLEQVAGKGGSIRNPSAYISKTIEHGYDPQKGGDSGKGSGKGLGGKSAAKAEELGLDLDDEALDALAHIPLSAAYELLEDAAVKGDEIRNQSGWIIGACAKIGKGAGKGQSKRGGGKSAAHAEELGLQLDDAALEALANIPLTEALQLIEDTASKRVRDPSRYISAACHNINQSGGSKGSRKGGHDEYRTSGSRSAQRAAELGLDLEEGALDALAHVPLGEALNLLDDVAAKGTGRNGSIRNPSGYIMNACHKINSGKGMSPAIVGGKGKGPGAIGGRAGAPMTGSPGNKSAERAASLGIELSEEAIAALGAVPLRDAFSLLDSMGGKGRIRDPSAYVIGAVGKMGSGAGVPAPSRSRQGTGGYSSVEQRVIDLNRSGMWGGEKIDVEAMLALKRLSERDAQDLLDSLESKGRGKGGSTVKNPSNYIGAAVSRILGDSGPARKRPRYEEDHHESRRGGGGGARESGRIASHARRVGLHLDREALDALEAQREDDAMHMLEQVAELGSTIKNPSKYIVSACARGLDFSRGPPSKRPRH